MSEQSMGPPYPGTETKLAGETKEELILNELSQEKALLGIVFK